MQAKDGINSSTTGVLEFVVCTSCKLLYDMKDVQRGKWQSLLVYIADLHVVHAGAIYSLSTIG